MSRSLTFISGSEPSRSASAIRNIAVRWNTRIASSVASTSSGVGAAHRALEQLGELLARRRRVEHPGVEQLVEQHWVLGDLAREPRALTDEVEQALERRGILVEEREIGAAPADRPIHGQHALESRRGASCSAISATVRVITAASRCRATSSMR